MKTSTVKCRRPAAELEVKTMVMKKILTLGLSVCMAASLMACSGSSTASSGTASSEAQESTAESAAASTAAAEAESSEAVSEETESSEAAAESTEAAGQPEQTEPLLVYLNDFDAVIGDLFKEATGYDVEVVVGNGAETMSRIEAEKSNPQWDVVWIDSMYDVYNLSQDGSLLTDWEPENAANLTDFAKSLVPENKCFYPTGAHAAGVLVYRTDVYDETTAPKTIDDLTDPRFEGQVGMADPGVAAPAYPLAAEIMYSKGLEEGEAWFSTLFDQGLKVYPKNPQVVQALASGEISVALLQESNAYEMVDSGEPIAIVWPEEGAPASPRVAAISASTDQEEIAKMFVNFLLDPDTQQALVNTGDEGFFEPSVEGVTPREERDPDAKLVVADTAWGAENEADIKAWFADMSAQ